MFDFDVVTGPTPDPRKAEPEPDTGPTACKRPSATHTSVQHGERHVERLDTKARAGTGKI